MLDELAGTSSLSWGGGARRLVLVQSVAPSGIITAVRDDGEDNDALAVDEIKHPMGELGQQGPSGSGHSVHDDLGGGLLFYPGKHNAQG